MSMLGTQLQHLQYAVSSYVPQAPKVKAAASMSPATIQKIHESKIKDQKKIIAFIEKNGQTGTVQIGEGIGKCRSMTLRRLYVMESEGLVLRKKAGHALTWGLK